MRVLFLTCLLLLGLAPLAQSAIWTATQEWSDDWEDKYRQWIQSDAVHTGIFHNKSSPYYGVKVDCADTAYGLRAIFALENELPYQIKNPLYRPGSTKTPAFFSNEMNNWDNLATQEARLVAFLKLVNGALGTENLSFSDTFSLKLDAIVSGDLFLYKIKSNGKAIRHAYVLKDITDVGNFDLIYSTQASKKDDKPLTYKKNQDLSHAPKLSPWGFKRFRWPQEYANNPTLERGHSLEQYELAKTLSERDFFKRVKKTLSRQEESDNEQLTRYLADLCQKVKDRVESVAAGVNYSTKVKRCLNYEEYDAYSTPNRDSHIKEEINKLSELYNDLEATGMIGQIDPDKLVLAQAIFAKASDESGHEVLLSYCPVEYAPGKVLNMREIVQGFKAGKMSSHPSDMLERRWGQGKTNATKCQAFY